MATSQGGDRFAGRSGAERGWICPACRGTLVGRESGWDCGECGQAFPIVAELPDLRLRSDRYLDLPAERAKAERLARHEVESNVQNLAATYYAMTADVDNLRRARYLAHLTRAEARGEVLAALLPRGARVLEVGCGTGGLLVAANRAGVAIEGADIALRWLVVARRRLADRGRAVPLVGASAEALPWPDGSFDAVVADSLLEHLDDPTRALQEFRRVVRPGGRLLLWSPNRFALTTDPHVGLWGVGWLPRHWAPAYVRQRRGCSWPVRPLSASEAAGLAVSAGWDQVTVEAPALAESLAPDLSPLARSVLKGYEVARRLRGGRGLVRLFGPLWELRGTKGTGRSVNLGGKGFSPSSPVDFQEEVFSNSLAEQDFLPPPFWGRAGVGDRRSRTNPPTPAPTPPAIASGQATPHPNPPPQGGREVERPAVLEPANPKNSRDQARFEP